MAAQRGCPSPSPIPSRGAGTVPLGTTTGFPSPLLFLPPKPGGEPEHPHFSGHRLANGLLICSIVPCEANSISARDSSLAVDTVMDRTSGCHRQPRRLLGTPGTRAGPPLAHRRGSGGANPPPRAQGSVSSNEK